MNLKSFKHNDWTKIWDGGWSVLSCSDFGYQYTKGIRFGKRPFAPQSIIFAGNGRSAGWMRQTDRDILGNYLSKQAIADPKSIVAVSNELKKQAKDILGFIKINENTVANLELFENFWQRVLVYYKPHINVKYVVDYLDPKLLKKYLPKLQEARLAAETVLNRTEDFIIAFAKILSKKTKYDRNLILSLTRDEVVEYFTKHKLPGKKELEQRYKRSVYLHENGAQCLFSGVAVNAIEIIVHPKISHSEVEGAIAFGGKISGIVRIVPDPSKVKVFNKGDILVTGATRPEFLPIMDKAAAFVTDAGGILSHAAITSREMKKPCIIGTKIATKVFKDGDLVEVDANKGVVRKLKG
ncbi:MAG: PEP-utilizing enzyme [bacterium]|nr:PEP-utilizing enzyme [bacterium]